jgi:hypothetical protein
MPLKIILREKPNYSGGVCAYSIILKAQAFKLLVICVNHDKNRFGLMLFTAFTGWDNEKYADDKK